MSDLYRAFGVAIDEDLKPLVGLLRQHGVAHRIFEEGGQQVLMVEGAEQADKVRALYEDWRSGAVRIEERQRPANVAPDAWPTQWRSAPVVLCLALFSIAGFLLFKLNATSWITALTFTPYERSTDVIGIQSMGSQYWRLVTPVFLHFGWLHIVFNCLWLWELGARVEQVMGHFNTFMLFLFIAVVSNVSQFIFGGVGLFGGMSGVVYGLLGFSWIAPLLQPAWPIRPPKPVMILMVGWLLACLVGMVEVLGFGAIANAAHLGGLLCGLALGAVFGAYSRFGGDNSSATRV